MTAIAEHMQEDQAAARRARIRELIRLIRNPVDYKKKVLLIEGSVYARFVKSYDFTSCLRGLTQKNTIYIESFRDLMFPC